MDRMIALGASCLLMPSIMATAVAAESDGSGIVEEIVVTSTYRETNLMETPQSISAITDSLVEDLGAQSMEDVYTMVPGLSMQGSTNGNARYTVRGITSQSGNIGYAPAGATVGVYLDGTPVSAALGPDNQVSGTLFDINRVEVLKGPQGTLFGEGSQSGTIRYLYNQPDTTKFDAAVNASMAAMEESDDMSSRIDGMINIPFGEGFALRLTGWQSTTAGFIENLEPFEEDYNEAESVGGRAALRFEGESFAITGSFFHSVQETKGGSITDRPYERLAARIPGSPPESQDEIDILSLVVDIDFSWATFQSLTSYTDREITSVTESGPVGAAILDFFYGGATEAADHPLCDPAITFGLCPGFVGVFNFGGPQVTPDGMNLQAISGFGDSYSERIVQEFRLVSPSDQRLRWTAGAFWKDSEDHTQNMQVGGYFPGREDFGDRFTPLLSVPANTHTDFLEEYAVFGEVSYDLTDTLELTVGARLSDLEQEFTNTGTGTDDTTVSPKVVLAWQVSDDLMLFANYATGFRPGNVNNNMEFYAGQFEQSIDDLLVTPGLPDAQPAIDALEVQIENVRANLFFEGDEVSSFEVGLKTTLWDGRVAVLASAYYLDWQDMLVYVTGVAPGGDVHNANTGGAEVQGIEVEINAFITDRLSVRLAGDYNDTEVSEAEPLSQTVDGNELIYAPNSSASFAIDYALPIARGWMIDFHADYAYVGEQWVDGGNTVEIDSYDKINARITARGPEDKWRVALYATNLANDEIVRGATTTGGLYWHSPRQIGLEVGYKL